MPEFDNLTAPKEGLKILVVEDEPDLVTYMSNLLTDHGKVPEQNFQMFCSR